MSKKRPKEIVRTMGTMARRKFVASLPCAACGVVGYAANAHVLGVAGIGLKKGHTTIAPLCGPRPSENYDGLFVGCHYLYDRLRGVFNNKYPTFDAEKAAEETETLWCVFLASRREYDA